MQPYLKSIRNEQVEYYLECPKCGELVRVKVI